MTYLVPGAGAVASFLIYRRFGFQYLFLAAMIMLAFMPQYWTTSRSGQHAIVAGFYAAGLSTVAVVRRTHRFDYLDEEYSVVEAMLWLGLYLAVNLELSPENLRSLLQIWQPAPAKTAEFSATFYWTTYALIWCLPAAMLWRAMTKKRPNYRMAWRDYCDPDTGHQQAISWLAAPPVGPNASGRTIDGRRHSPQALACERTRRRPQQVHRSTPLWAG